MTGGENKLVVGVLFPPTFDVEYFAARVGPQTRPLDVRLVPYMDLADVRLDKGKGVAAERLRPLEPPLSPDDLARLAEIEVALALDVPIDMPTLAPNLRWLQAIGAGVTQLIRTFDGTPVRVTSSAGVGGPAIAEFVMARLLQIAKRIRLFDEQQAEHTWKSQSTAMLAGRTMGIVGLGAIGTEIARRATAFDMRVVATRRNPAAGGPAGAEVHGTEWLPQLLATSDVVVLSAPATDETENLIGTTELASMRPGSVFVNVARGSLVDEDAVVTALESGHLRAAVIDAFRTEPLPAESPLWTAPNAYLSPHSSASFDEYGTAITNLFAENLQNYESGAELRNLVDPRRGY
jgi:phosphoglycerate dehydrogenase-like enzyme